MKKRYYTGKGDDGSTTLFACSGTSRFSKNDPLIVALGNIDELNSMLGLCRALSKKLSASWLDVARITFDVQQNLFIAQAQLAGADKKITSEHILTLESMIDALAEEAPLIDHFVISGEHECVAMLDYARSLTRRTERSLIDIDIDRFGIDKNFLAYFNRLSSLLFILARVVAQRLGVKESAPHY